ncbi:hypothetical protein [Corynebacterium pseudopelargi]|uniref:Uncharacterized protein n=1 Tax=Corynebacterium pseudopelargi TaxID=2080757 RepID=A0A3G6ISM9_9CORY|nr:hypothetical protein [Corynebacterium pseudopelargi]AZA08632.1 hypothetical protein CPPEL_02480 [Corynebacterium pseudopelargi]
MSMQEIALVVLNNANSVKIDKATHTAEVDGNPVDWGDLSKELIRLVCASIGTNPSRALALFDKPAPEVA